jgi:ABC-type branched-subunit amino acid transport system substrate-binding protein
MQGMTQFLTLSGAVAVLTVTTAVLAQKEYGPGVSDTEIKIGQTMPYSGPTTATATIGKAHAAYFEMINERGGINGRRIRLISLDDGYSPAKTVEQTRKLVERDGALLMFGSVGTGPQTSVQKYLNAHKVPQLFITTATLKLVNPFTFPWTMPFYPNQRIEVAPLAQYLLSRHPTAKIGVLYQNDDYGKGFVQALREALGDKAQSLIVAEASYEVSDPTIDSQIIALHGAGADVLFNFSTPKFGSFAIRKTHDLGWRPLHFVTGPSTSIGATLMPAGLDKSIGLLSAGFLKDPSAAEWQDDAATKEWLAWMKRYYPQGDIADWMNVYAYTSAQALVHVLQRCGDNLTRENVMREAAGIKDLVLPMFLPGIRINTSATEYYPVRGAQLLRCDGRAWVRIPDASTAQQPAGAATPVRAR